MPARMVSNDLERKLTDHFDCTVDIEGDYLEISLPDWASLEMLEEIGRRAGCLVEEEDVDTDPACESCGNGTLVVLHYTRITVEPFRTLLAKYYTGV